MIFLLLPFLFLFTPASGTIECKHYNMKYPNLTLTKVNSEITNKTCEDVCVNYLCPVNFNSRTQSATPSTTNTPSTTSGITSSTTSSTTATPNNNETFFILGSGCKEDIEENCGDNIDFNFQLNCYNSTDLIACICASEDDEQCEEDLPIWFHSNPMMNFGWGHIYDIEWLPDVDGVTMPTTTSTTTSSTTTTAISSTTPTTPSTTTTTPSTTPPTTTPSPTTPTTTLFLDTSTTAPLITTTTTTPPFTTGSACGQFVNTLSVLFFAFFFNPF